MTYYGGPAMARAYRTVRRNTIQIAGDIPAEHYGFTATPDSMSVAGILAHVAYSPLLQLEIQGTGVTDITTVDFGGLLARIHEEQQKPRDKAATLAMLEAEGERFASYLDGLSDAFLAEAVTMPPGADPAAKSRFEMLLGVKEHEMHHRAQLMIYQRQLGIVPHFTRQQAERRAQMAQK